MGPSDSSQASTTCCGETPWRSAAERTASTPAVPPAFPMPPNGDQGRKAMPRRVHASTSPLANGLGKFSASWFCTATTSTMPSASSSWATSTFESPTHRILPSSRSSFRAPTDSREWHFGSGRWYW